MAGKITMVFVCYEGGDIPDVYGPYSACGDNGNGGWASLPTLQPSYADRVMLSAEEYQGLKALIQKNTSALPDEFSPTKGLEVFGVGFGVVISAFVLTRGLGMVLDVIRSAWR